MPKILIPLIDGFEEIEAISCIDILRRAGFDVITAGIGKGTATGSHKITLRTDAILADVVDGEFDLILLPGGPGTKQLVDVADLQHRLRQQVEGGKRVAAICAAPMILARAGILKGRKATCFPAVENELAEGGATLFHDEVVVDGMVTTSRGAGTAIPFALEIVAAFAGREKADQLGSSIIYRANG